MPFELLKKLVVGSAEKPSGPLVRALRPLAAPSAALSERCVAYVHDGSEAAVLLELERAQGQGLFDLMGHPASLQGWWHPQEATEKALRSVGLTPEAVPRGRHRYYLSAAKPEQLVRFAHVLTAVAHDVERQVPGVPVWLTALLNDLMGTLPHSVHTVSRLAKTLPRWNAGFVVDLLMTDGHPREEAEALALAAMIQKPLRETYDEIDSSDLPGVDVLLADRGLAVKEAGVLTAKAKTWLMERATRDQAVAVALTDVVAAFTVESAKGPRTAALRVLKTLPEATRAAAIRPVLAKAPASRAADLVDLLGQDSQGMKLLDEAVKNGAKITSLVAKVGGRQHAIAAEQPDEPLVVPPFTPVPELELTRSDVEPLRAVLQEMGRVRQDHLDQVIAVANGSHGRVSLLNTYNLWWLSRSMPSLNLIHLLRLSRAERPYYLAGALDFLEDDDALDLRAVEDAVRRAGVHSEQIGRDGISDNDLAGLGVRIPGDKAWPWFAGRPDLVERWLEADAEKAGQMLEVLAHFPQLPGRVLPKVAKLALSESRTNRPRAQAALAGHPSAQALAAQGLADGKGEIRAAAAGWIAAQEMVDGVELLRGALGKERREDVRAAMLTALEMLGDDIAVHLAPAVLEADAAKALKVKPPASMDWLDLDLLPTVRWADGSVAAPALLRWWVVLAVKLKNPDGSGLLDRYLSLLHPDDAAEVGRFALRWWIAQDTRHPDEADSRAHAEATGEGEWNAAQALVKRLRRQRKIEADWLRYAEEQAARPVEAFIADAFREDQAIYMGSAIADKGLLALTTRMPGLGLASSVQSYIRLHGGRRAQVEALVHALFANGDPAAIQVLLSISRRFRQATVQAKAKELVERLAEQRGWTSDELADRTIPTAAFDDDGLLRLSYGEREFLGRVNTAFGIDVADPDGKPIKALPKPRLSDDEEAAAEAKKQLTASRKELKAVLTLQAARLYDAMCGGRSWPASVWREFLMGHPLMAQLIARLIWTEASATGERRFRPAEDGALVDLSDEPLTLADDAEIRLAHGVLMGDDEARAWREHLADYGVVALFDQLSATVPAHAEGAVALDDLKGHMTDSFSFRGVATKRGYVRGGAQDAGWFTEYTKGFSGLGLTAVLEFTGSYLPEDNIPCATESLFFQRGHRQVPLKDVPPVLLAECYADYAAVAALGPFHRDYHERLHP